jgi:hypothetical protein
VFGIGKWKRIWLEKGNWGVVRNGKGWRWSGIERRSEWVCGNGGKGGREELKRLTRSEPSTPWRSVCESLRL